MSDLLADDETNLSRVERVYRSIRGSILSNQFPAGYQALEPEIAKQLGVSRTPVREALIRLEAEKLIELIPRRGMRVLPLAPRDYKEICQIIAGLEVLAVELLIDTKPGKDVLAPLEDSLIEMDAAQEQDDLERWANADDKFHRLLVSLCENSRLANMVQTARVQTYRSRMMILKLRAKPMNSTSALRELYQAILQGNKEIAKDIHYKHKMDILENSMELLGRYSLPHL